MIAALKDAFAYCEKAYDGMTDASASQMVKVFGREMPKPIVLTVNNMHATEHYGNLIVYAGVDLDIERGERIALVGVNGAGKSTLLRILAGVLPFDRGERTLGAHVAAHYYAQHQLDALDPERSVLEELEAVAPEAARTRLRTVLGNPGTRTITLVATAITTANG